jgi:quinol monooxygenase YgiN
MYGMLTRITVKPGKRTELLEYLRWDAEVAKASEPGTWRFDVWETEREPGVVYLYEAYKDRGPLTIMPSTIRTRNGTEWQTRRWSR